ncbi:glutathione S-transferase family protein [Terrihabitans sp. B22-R8]|uniref:glutathione S-transferase family protein n=1 Tax=Terrihabitans sp. B22-R8 TaxID=3425128 RepID=UPI00403C7029
MSLTLIIGNKNYSSWSLRPWLAMKQTGIAFEEVVIPIYIEGSKQQILSHSPAGKVPALNDDGFVVWDSLAIIEYLAELVPERGLWPADRHARAMARAICAEMHSGFVPLRKALTMNARRRIADFEAPPEALENVARIEEIWSAVRGRYGAGGPFLFGQFTAADAFYAPVVSRFETYGIEVAPENRAYMDGVLNLPAMQDWNRAAAAEPWTLPQFEV